MNALDFDQAADETIQENDTSTHPPAHGSDGVVAALALVSETAAAIKTFEEHAAHTLIRAKEVADATKEELDRSEMRAEAAETMLRLAESQVEQMYSALEQAREELQSLRSQLASTTAELVASERRADDAEIAIEQIMNVIRAQLPAKLNITSE